MSAYLTYSEDFLKEHNGYWTAREISQQPRIWREAAENVKNENSAIQAWLLPLLANTNLRIILTGAGTSAYVGNAIAPHLSTKTGRLFEAISTTDLVSNPLQYLIKDIPTLVVSYGRSGNSPESVAAVKLVDQVVDDSYHLILTCNPEGELAVNAKTQDNVYSIIMPEGTLDQSFAMTSSFSSMLVSTLSIFAPEASQLELAAQATENLLSNGIEKLKAQAKKPTERLVFLGAGGFQGIAKEAALKCLELTAGQVLSYFESPLGFRHGPKSLMDATTEVVIFASSNDYTKLYDADLIAELKRDDQALDITILSAETFNQKQDIEDVWAGLPYIVYCQILAFYKSIDADITPDNPCPTGEVNRVVQGVTLYALKQQ
ncbi:SIS domain-containing protein [Colwellia sp. Bg11-28]|uniref:SIS domain-containing protein n=1 Tax=Colwellia sp. Bg11-28 TaxID=2058305 RepID=UPI000C347BA9|nr:SIS domain-containing protein [Colwellia sp. Bg11-28]PKH88528.1 sugar isomerase [Colwellia sp. Bg11-28]